MKTFTWKFLVACLLAMFTIGAYASWRCQASNHRGQAWSAVSQSKDYAASSAMKSCRWNTRSHYRHGGCRIDFCQPVGRHHRSYQSW